MSSVFNYVLIALTLVVIEHCGGNVKLTLHNSKVVLGVRKVIVQYGYIKM